jgi:hypothetical protein
MALAATAPARAPLTLRNLLRVRRFVMVGLLSSSTPAGKDVLVQFAFAIELLASGFGLTSPLRK